MPLSKEEARQRLIQDGLNPDDYDLDNLQTVPSESAPAQAPSAGRAALLTGRRSIIPALAGGAAGLGVSALFPPAAPAILPLLAGGLTAAGGGYLASKGQEAVIKGSESPEEYQKGIEELEAARKAHPLVSLASEVAPNLAFARPSLGGIKALPFIGRSGTALGQEGRSALMNLGVGAGVQGAISAGQQYLTEGKVSPLETAVAAGVGGLFNKPQLLGRSKLLGYRGEPTPNIPEVVNKSEEITPTSTLTKVEPIPFNAPPGLDIPAAPFKQWPAYRNLYPKTPQMVNEQPTPPSNVGADLKANKGMVEALPTPKEGSETMEFPPQQTTLQQPESSVINELKDQLAKARRGASLVENPDIIQQGAELLARRGVKKIIFDPNLPHAGQYDPTTSEVTFGPKSAIDTILHEGLHAQYRQPEVQHIAGKGEDLVKEAATKLGVSPEEVLVEAAGLRGSKLLLNKLEGNLSGRVKNYVQDLMSSFKTQTGLGRLSKEDVVNLLARSHYYSGTPAEPSVKVGGLTRQPESELMPKGMLTEEQLAKAKEEGKDWQPSKARQDFEKYYNELYSKYHPAKMFLNKATQNWEFNSLARARKDELEHLEKLRDKLQGEERERPMLQEESSLTDKIEPGSKGVAPAKFFKEWPSYPEWNIKGFKMYNLTEDIEGHNKNSTVAGETLEKLGYKLPPSDESIIVKEQGESKLTSEAQIRKKLTEKVSKTSEKFQSLNKEFQELNTKFNNSPEHWEQWNNLSKATIEAATEADKAMQEHWNNEFGGEKQLNQPESKILPNIGSRSEEIAKFKEKASKIPGRRVFWPTQTELDSIRIAGGKEGNQVADALERWYVDRDRLNGKYTAPIFEATQKLLPEEKTHLEKILTMENREGKSYENLLTSNNERDAYKIIREKLKEKQEDQIKAKQPVTAWDESGRPFQRLPKINNFYYPGRIDPRVIETITNHPTSEVAKNLRNDFLTYQAKEGIGSKEALAKLNSIETALDEHSPNYTRFNANREMEGIGLPDSWLRADLERNLQNYFRRVSADRAWHDNIETNHDVAKALGYEKTPWGKDIESENQNIRGIKAVGDAVEKIQGEPFDREQQFIKDINRVSTALMLGPATNFHIIASSLVSGMAHFNPAELVQASINSIVNFKKNIDTTLATGYRQKNFSTWRDIIDATKTGSERIQGVTNLIGKFNGRQLVDSTTKILLQGYGDSLVKIRLSQANKGNTDAINFLKHLDNNYKIGKSYSAKEMEQLASTWAGFVHGFHDSRTLPSWMLKDTAIQPFLSLASWNIAQTNQWMRAVWTPATKGDFTPLIMSTFGAALGGLLLKETREKITAKKSPIPGLDEIINSSKGLEGNIPLVAYNFMAQASYVGYAGLLSQTGKWLFDMAYKNKPQGATFPLDEVITNTATTISEGISALKNGEGNYFELAYQMGRDLARENVQLGRIAIAHLADAGVLPEEQYRKYLADHDMDLRKFRMLEGYPYTTQDIASTNPYYKVETKVFKREQDISKAGRELYQDVIPTYIKKYGSNIEVLRSQLRGLKQEGGTEFIPSIEHTPIQALRYINFIKKTQGEEKANELMQHYFRTQLTQKIKSSLVPTL